MALVRTWDRLSSTSTSSRSSSSCDESHAQHTSLVSLYALFHAREEEREELHHHHDDDDDDDEEEQGRNHGTGGTGGGGSGEGDRVVCPPLTLSYVVPTTTTTAGSNADGIPAVYPGMMGRLLSILLAPRLEAIRPGLSNACLVDGTIGVRFQELNHHQSSFVPPFVDEFLLSSHATMERNRPRCDEMKDESWCAGNRAIVETMIPSVASVVDLGAPSVISLPIPAQKPSVPTRGATLTSATVHRESRSPSTASSRSGVSSRSPSASASASASPSPSPSSSSSSARGSSSHTSSSHRSSSSSSHARAKEMALKFSPFVRLVDEAVYAYACRQPELLLPVSSENKSSSMEVDESDDTISIEHACSLLHVEFDGENLSEFTHRLFVQEVLATISSSSSFPDPARFTILSAMSGKKPDFVSSYWAHIYSHCQDMLSQRALRLQTHEVGIPSVEFARRRIAYRRSPPEGMDLGSIGALFKIACEISTLFRLNTLPSWNPDASQHLDSISGDSGSLSPTSKSETASLNDSSRSSESAESSQSEHANVAMETKTSPHTRVLHGSDANIDDMKKSQGYDGEKEKSAQSSFSTISSGSSTSLEVLVSGYRPFCLRGTFGSRIARGEPYDDILENESLNNTSVNRLRRALGKITGPDRNRVLSSYLRSHEEFLSSPMGPKLSFWKSFAHSRTQGRRVCARQLYLYRRPSYHRIQGCAHKGWRHHSSFDLDSRLRRASRSMISRGGDGSEPFCLLALERFMTDSRLIQGFGLGFGTRKNPQRFVIQGARMRRLMYNPSRRKSTSVLLGK